MSDDHTETKEERKARKAAKKQAKEDKLKVDGIDNVESTADKTKTKTKKRKAELDLDADVTTSQDVSTSTKDEVPAASSSSSSTSKKQKKEKKTPIATSTTTITDADPQATPTSASTTTPTPTSTAAGPTEPAPKKSKKSKKLKSAAIQARPPVSDEDKVNGGEQGEEKVQEGKEVKEVKEVTQPGEDGSLNEQSQKALQYAHLHSQNKKDKTVIWKFNKARQGWLLRNVWFEENIPERWVDLTIDYLKTIQGLAKNNMIGDAKKRLEQPEVVTPDADADVDMAGKEDDPEAYKGEKPESVDSPTATAPTETEEEAGNPKVDDKAQEVIRERARRLLRALDIEL